MITNAKENELYQALREVNRKYNNNLTIINLKRKSKNRLSFRLSVLDSSGHGSRISPFTGRRVKAACWHAHGDFFDTLFEINSDVFIIARKKRITKENNWQDWNAGSVLYPVYFSECCSCGSDTDQRRIQWKR